MDTTHPITAVPTPDPELSPAAVVDRQVTALANNDDPVENAGIKTAYNFASPANRAATGPLGRFIDMVEGPAYRPMIDHEEAVAGPVERDGDQAAQRVTVTGPSGRTVTYTFGLSRQSDGAYENCWLTDRVVVE